MHMLHIPHKVEVLLWSEAQLAERKKGVVLWVVVEEGVGQLVLSLAGKKSVNGTIRKKKPLTHRDRKDKYYSSIQELAQVGLHSALSALVYKKRSFECSTKNY